MTDPARVSDSGAALELLPSSALPSARSISSITHVDRERSPVASRISPAGLTRNQSAKLSLRYHILGPHGRYELPPSGGRAEGPASACRFSAFRASSPSRPPARGAHFSLDSWPSHPVNSIDM